jgi:hypothetical protein
MLYKLTETIIEYNPADLEAWKRGEKDKWIGDREVPNDVYNQPGYHFGEYYVLNQFEKEGWHGYVFYAIGKFEPNNEKYREGREKVEELFPKDRLEAFRTIRSKSTHAEAKGEPDLFLYMDNGPKLFLEVKKDTDRVFDAQLECLAQIRGILGAEIGIVHLVKYGTQYTPKAFELDLVTYRGKSIAQ